MASQVPIECRLRPAPPPAAAPRAGWPAPFERQFAPSSSAQRRATLTMYPSGAHGAAVTGSPSPASATRLGRVETGIDDRRNGRRLHKPRRCPWTSRAQEKMRPPPRSRTPCPTRRRRRKRLATASAHVNSMTDFEMSAGAAAQWRLQFKTNDHPAKASPPLRARAAGAVPARRPGAVAGQGMGRRGGRRHDADVLRLRDGRAAVRTSQLLLLALSWLTWWRRADPRGVPAGRAVGSDCRRRGGLRCRLPLAGPRPRLCGRPGRQEHEAGCRA